MPNDDIIKTFQVNMCAAKQVLPVLIEQFQLVSLYKRSVSCEAFSKMAIVVAGEVQKNETNLILICEEKDKKTYFSRFSAVFKLKLKFDDDEEREYKYFVDTYENIKEKILGNDEIYSKMYNPISSKLYDPSERFTKTIEKLNKVKGRNSLMKWFLSKFI